MKRSSQTNYGSQSTSSNNNKNNKPISSIQRRALSYDNIGRLTAVKDKSGFGSDQSDQDHSTNHRIKYMWQKLKSNRRDSRQLSNSYSDPPTPAILSSSLPPEIGSHMPRASCPNSPQNSDMDNYFGLKKQTKYSTDRYASSPNLDTVNKKPIKKLHRKKKNSKEILARFHSDVVGVVFLEVSNARDLPPVKNLTRTSFDMDPFVVVSYGSTTFKTSVVRHNLNPVWNQKLFFHVRHNEEKYHLKFTVYDRENFSGNDLVAWHQVPITDIITQSQQRQSKNASSSDNLTDMIDRDMDRYKLPLQMIKSEKYKDKKPVLNIRAKFMPYNEIRKLFWRALLKAYDVDSTGSMNRLEVQSMLETIGSTITESTIDTFWRRYNKDPRNELEELTINQIVECLEEQMLAESTLGLQEPYSKNTYLNHSLGLEVFPTDTFTQGFTEPGNVHQDGNTHGIHDESDCDDEDDEDDDEDEDEENDDNNIDNWISMFDGFNLEMYDERRPSTSGFSSPLSFLDRDKFDYSTPPITEEPLSILSNDNVDLAEALIEEENDIITSLPFRSPSLSRKYRRNSFAIEKVIRLTECPVCHRPNLSQRSQMDIVTHVATCVANDWTTVGRFLMGNFFTEAYAQRRWFVKLVRKVGYGKYSPGKDNANIFLHERSTGRTIEEHMSVYIRLGMRLVYKGMKTGIQSKAAQKILAHLTVRQGRRFDSRSSAREIPAFIKFHNIQMDEVLEPLSNFRTFNQFFYRKLKPGSRPPDSPEDPTVAVSPADSRMTAFETVNEATRVWIKGLDFSIKKLLGNNDYASSFEGGSLSVLRLAPQDYHRFHSPVDGVVTSIKHISGQYFTVNPMAIRTTIDVFGENARTVIMIKSNEFGNVAVVCVGAMLVGSIIMTVKVGSKLKRTDEMGYFAFGGSTLVVIFQKDAISFDHDLLNNSDNAVETLVRVGNHIGSPPH